MEENNENILNETEEKDLALVNEENNGAIMSFADMQKRTNTQVQIYTNIEDRKKLFNLESKVDCLLNDCENECIRVKGVLIKIFKKPLAEPVIDEETGEILKEFETTMSTILVDDTGKSYATGSKVFSIQLMRFIQNYGEHEFDKGMEMKIVKTKNDNGNKTLGFEWI